MALQRSLSIGLVTDPAHRACRQVCPPPCPRTRPSVLPATPRPRSTACRAQSQQQLLETVPWEHNSDTQAPLCPEPAAPVAHMSHWLETLGAEAGQQPVSKDWWSTFQSVSEPYLPTLNPAMLTSMITTCSQLKLSPCPRWLRACTEALITALEKADTAVAPSLDEQATRPEEGVPALLGKVLATASVADSELDTAAPVARLPGVLAAVMDWHPGQATQQLCMRGMALLHQRVEHMQHVDLAHMVHVLLGLHEAGSLSPTEPTSDLHAPTAGCDAAGLLNALVGRTQQLAWSPQHVGQLAVVVAGTAKLGEFVPSAFLGACLHTLTASSTNPAAAVKALTIDQVLALTQGLLAYAAAATPGTCARPVGWTDPARTLASVSVPPDEAAVWLLGWGQAFAGQVFTSRAAHMTLPQLVQAAVLMHSLEQAIADCMEAASPNHYSQSGRRRQALARAAMSVQVGLPPLCQELEVSIRQAPVSQLGAHMEQLTAAAPHMAQHTLRTCASACIDRLQREEGAVSHCDPVQLIISLAALWEHMSDSLQPGWTRLLQKLLEASRPLLPSCQTNTLVHVISALTVLGHHPDQQWQAMYFCTLRSRLPLLQSDELHCILGALTPLNLTPDELWVNDVFSASRKLLPHMTAHQVADLVWTLSQQAPCMEWLWAAPYEKASIEHMSELSPVLLAATIKSLTSLSYRPSAKWMNAFMGALQARLFAPTAVQLCVSWPDDKPAQTVMQHMTARSRVAGESVCRQAPPPQEGLHLWTPITSRPEASGGAAAVVAANTGAVTVDSLMVIVGALMYARAQPGKEWMQDFMDAVRCKLSLLSSHQLAELLMFCATMAYVPSQEWWDDYLSVAKSTLTSSSINDNCTHLALLNSMGVVPDRAWLAAWCHATQERLCMFLPQQLHQVLSCLAAADYTPNMAWLSNAQRATEHVAHAFEPSELLRSLVILERMGTTPSATVMQLVFSPHAAAGLRGADPAVLAQLMWMLQGPVAHPPAPDVFASWLEEYCAAAQASLPLFSATQLECAMSGLMAVQHAAAVRSGSVMAQVSVGQGGGGGVGGRALPSCVSRFILMAREWV